MSFEGRLRPLFLSIVGIIFFCSLALAASAPTMIKSAVDESKLVSVARSTHPSARAEFDQGPAPADLPMDRMLLVLKRSPDRQAALDEFSKELQDPSSTNYHKWLTPEQFGEQFGASDADIATITTWLQSHGFQVQPPYAGKGIIEFSGTAGQVKTAFHTEIHSFKVNGANHWANATDQQIPAALASAVAGVATLHNFTAAPQSAVKGNIPTDSKLWPYATLGGGNYLSPADYTTIYNIKPLYPSITGSGVVIGVIGRSNINIQDVLSFRSLMGLPANPPNIIVNGSDPGDLGGGEEVEAVLDTSWSGALAYNATVDFVVSATTNTTDGVDLSEAYIINNNLASVMTESFGECETELGSAEEAMISSNAQQAAAQGITYMVSSGDTGSAGCDSSSQSTATHPISVNGLASTQYNVAVGGTQFNENGTPSLYWNSTNSAYFSSALSYIPEDVWNDNCNGSTCGTGNILAAGGGASVFNAKPSWQTGVTGIPADGHRDVPDVALTAAGHDGYLLCVAGSCSSDEFAVIYGTSASAPSFASIVALVSQSAGGRLGQLTPRLYALAAAETLSGCNGSNTSGLPGANCVFNDVTVGTNAVPGEANYNTANETYPATVGYDLASGLGSVNVTNLVNSWGGYLAALPEASLAPGTLSLGSQPVNVAGTPQNVVLSNPGSVALAISNIAIGGTNSGDFTQSNSCGSSLAAGGSCNISVTFKPTATGTRSATVTVTDNAGDVAGSTQSASLTGTGTSSTGSTAVYSGLDTTTQGTWTGHHGADGQMIANGLQNAPGYASVSISGDGLYTWAASTTDPRALQTASNSTTRAATQYYSSANNFTTFAINLNLNDGNSHQISFYLLDWDGAGRTETISIVDANTGTTLSTQSFSGFYSGQYATWTIKGHVVINVNNTGPANSTVSGIFFDTPATSTTSSATYGGLDTTTQGTWTGHYGADGQMIPNGLQNAPGYASVSLSGDGLYTWAASTTDPRALQTASNSTTRAAAQYYSSANNFTTFAINLNLTDGNSHQISLYLLDWDGVGRTETISIVDANTGTTLSTQSFSGFYSGQYATWTIKGHVLINVNRTGPANSTVSGIFFDTPATSTTSTATYGGLDTTTQGTWTGHHGVDGQMIANGLQNAPGYASVSISGDGLYTWAASTSDPRALQTASNSTTRAATQYYSSANNFTTFAINLNLTDGNSHQVSLYLLDWDGVGRTETISIVDANTGTTLSTQSFSGFYSGQYAIWTIKGHVLINVNNTGPANSTVSGIFFGS